ncbi:pentapeptide repeat-containing protein [Maritimibacter sp. HL-12]|uniref:pentapeptide repeat-containing protein n=1 Tax=Maritimibacter sp. HL-12 TaxID=1162418 RepID=UPI000A0EFC8E|nr:pentapeptide repeat-containing protein [Maritimibacter sp. HL-12]SMH31203.1 Uncharacterized low-complexity proteins [Maritimibacter sp. HL-12]
MSAEENKKTLSDWLGLQWKPDYGQNRVWGGFLGFAIQLIAAALVLIALGLLVAFGVSIYAAISAGTEITGEAIRNVGLALAAVFGAPFLVWRSIVAQRQTDIAEQSQITDRINKAVENLGATRTLRDADGNEAHAPNLEVRIGAIYALERIAQDSLRDHVQIMEILTAYVRENAKAEDAEQSPSARWSAAYKAGEGDDATKAAHAEAQTGLTKQAALDETRRWVRALQAPRTDIQAALTVIGRRSAEQKTREGDDTRQSASGYRLDLRKTILRGADLSNLDFAKARLDGARLDRAGLWNVRLDEAGLTKTHLEWTALNHAHFEGANLTEAHLEGAFLFSAQLQGAHFFETHLDEATEFRAADTNLAALRQVDLTGINLTLEQVAVMFGDGSVILPETIPRPVHWPSDNLDWSDFQAEWTLYKSDPATYLPPQDRPDPGTP